MEKLRGYQTEMLCIYCLYLSCLILIPILFFCHTCTQFIYKTLYTLKTYKMHNSGLYLNYRANILSRKKDPLKTDISIYLLEITAIEAHIRTKTEEIIQSQSLDIMKI